MRPLIPLAIAALVCLPIQQDAQTQGDAEIDWREKLAPVAGFVGEHRGKGRAEFGAYRERWYGEWINGKTAIRVRTESRAGNGATLFQDVRIFTYDPKGKRIRVRQFAQGCVTTYDVEVKDGGKTIVLHQKAYEGTSRPDWRYTISLKRGELENQVHYRLDRKKGDAFGLFLRGRLIPKSE